MRFKFLPCNYAQGSNRIKTGFIRLTASLHHSSESFHEEILPLAWYKENYPRLIKLSNLLKNVDLVDGKLLDITNNTTVNDKRLLRRLHNFKAISRAFLGNPEVQKEVSKTVKAEFGKQFNPNPQVYFTKPIERDPITIDTFTKVCNFLNISAQQRKTIRFTISPEITRHRIWVAVLEEILHGLKTDIELLDSSQSSNYGIFMGQQIVSTCLKFLNETAGYQDEVSSWMRPKPGKLPDSSSSRKWEEVLEMFRDLINYLKDVEELQFHVTKLEAMKEGLSQIKDVIIDRDIGYKDVLFHENLVQKRLAKTLGHPSRCLFTLLRYFLHRTICDMEVDVSGGLCEIGEKDGFCLYMGKILTSDEEEMILSGIKQLDKALGLFKFVWDVAKTGKKLELHGHLWCVEGESRVITYRGNLFFVDRIIP